MNETRRRQLDEALVKYKNLPTLKRGYIREVREALDMSAQQLSARVGITPASLNELQHNEVKGTITLNSLRRVAEAMDCQLVYAIVPNESLVAQLERKARDIALKITEENARTMALEDQAVTDETSERMIRLLTQQVMDSWGRKIWDWNDS
jgi:predicted DNA-binding mobile mystery protein A